MTTLLLGTVLVLALQDKPKAPPPGPPWTTDFKAARREALRDGKPLFLYFTKTY